MVITLVSIGPGHIVVFMPAVLSEGMATGALQFASPQVAVFLCAMMPLLFVGSIGSRHKIVDLDFALAVGSNGLIYSVTNNSELDTINLAVFGSLDDLGAAIADLQLVFLLSPTSSAISSEDFVPKELFPSGE